MAEFFAIIVLATLVGLVAGQFILPGYGSLALLLGPGSAVMSVVALMILGLTWWPLLLVGIALGSAAMLYTYRVFARLAAV